MNPKLLVLARESRGIPQSDLAGRIGISQGKLSKAEKGEQYLPEEILLELCQVLQYPRDFFYQESPNAPISHYYYRKRITIAQKTVNQMEAIIKIFRNNIDSFLESVELPQNDLVTFKTEKESPEEIARKIRYVLNIPPGPINNLVNLLESKGIIVVKLDLLSEKIDGLSTISEKGANIIFLNSRMPNDRQRFSLSHELGHMIMHFDLPSTDANVEDEANKFAAEFLMPESEIKNELRYLNFSKLGDLKRYWKVSMKSLIYRARSLNVIDQYQFRNFQINFSKRGMSKSEPIILPEEVPHTLNEVIRLHIDELGYSKEELAKMLKLNYEEFQERFISDDKPKLRVVRNIG